MIRPVRLSDMEAVKGMASAMFAESGYSKYLRYAPDKIVDQIHVHLNGDPRRLGLVAERDGELMGMFGGYVAPHAFANDADLIAHDLLVYVKPDKRGGTTAFRFLEHYECWAKQMGARYAVNAVTSEIEQGEKALLELYKAMGYKVIGFFVRKELA